MKYSLVLLIFFFVQCTNKKEIATSKNFTSFDLSVDEDFEVEPPRTSESSKYSFDKVNKNDKKIIKTGNLKIEINNLKKTKNNIDKILRNFNAYYENENFLAYENGNHYVLKIRVPSIYFDTLVSILEFGKGELISKNIFLKDVTEEYLDLKLRLQNKIAYLSQYKQILKKATTIAEILDVQEKIRRLEEEIESKEGKIKFLKDQVDFSTLKVELTEFTTSQKTKNKFSNKIIKALEDGIDLLLGLILYTISIWPLLLFLSLILFFRKRIIRIFKS